MNDTNESVVFKRKVFAKDNGKGESVADWTLTLVGINDPVQIVAQPIYTVPVIFVPGIMGSNLKLTQEIQGENVSKDKAVWLMNGKVAAAAAWASADAARRQRLLNPATTDVFDGGDVPDHVPTIGGADAIRNLRFWGEVGSMSYMSFLTWLEKTLNEKGRVAQWRGQLGQPEYATAIFKGLVFPELNESAVGHAANIRFPVYVCGYNWLQSNLNSAQRLKQRIEDVIKANCTKSYTCHKVILVTHSMGGLVARACSELLGMRGQIAGIVHGVMPATGAAVAYKRVRSGTEGSAGIVIGGTAAKVTAVFANSPGALQLLPSVGYGPGWLQLGSGVGRDFKTTLTLPQVDPYEEIYKQRGKWWSLVREELINPGKVDQNEGWGSYIKNINSAQSFHGGLATTGGVPKYHPNTFAFYGDGSDPTNGQTWGVVRWEMRQALEQAKIDRGAIGIKRQPLVLAPEALLVMPVADDPGVGTVNTTLPQGGWAQFILSGKDTVGDGTVPERSGRAPAQAGVKVVYHLNLDAEGHEGAYRVSVAQQATLHAILSIAKDIEVVV